MKKEKKWRILSKLQIQLMKIGNINLFLETRQMI